jgi:diguanylate cyclase (GGDEF)-like protein
VRTLLQLDEPTPHTRGAQVSALVAAIVYAALLIWALPASDVPLAPVAAVPLGHALALIVVTGLTAFVLWLAALRSGRRGFLVLGGTFSSITVIMIGFVLAFPSGFRTDAGGAPVPLLGGASTAVALFVCWHLVLALGAGMSAVVLTRDVATGRRPGLHRPALGIALGIAPATLLTGLLLAVHGLSPDLIAAGELTPTGRAVFQVTLAVAVAALVVTVLVGRGRSIIARWLIAVCVLNVGDLWLNLDASRYSVGWYVARGVGFVALSALLLLLVWELSRVDQRMHAIATRDALTGTRARVTFAADAEREIARADREGGRVGLMWLDLDVFKQINDRYGHDAGDALLVEVGRRVVSAVREADLVVRMGGDEFAVLLVGLDGVDSATTVAQRVVASLRAPVSVGTAQVAPRASVGIAIYPDTAVDVEELVHQADVAMYAAKSGGGDRWLLYDPAQDVGYTSRALLRRRLDEALVSGGLDLDAQPIVSAQDGSLHGVELLLRWEHDGARVSGGPFAMEAERMGRSAEIAHVVLDRAEAALVELRSRPGLGLVSINICVTDLLDSGVLTRLAAPPLADAADLVVLELTETAAIGDDAAVALERLEPLRARGYRLAVDDFGVGFSNIVRLQQLRPDIIKIDRSMLVRAAQGLDRDAEVLAWAVSIGRTLGALVVVEGVETDAEADIVRRVGADLAQGYLFGRPSPLRSWTSAGAAVAPAAAADVSGG